MAKGPEELKNRLENIHSIEPLLAALRTISLSNWRYSLNKIEIANQYLGKLFAIYNALTPIKKFEDINSSGPSSLLIIIGSNRGLCSNFNRDILSALLEKVSEMNDAPRIVVFGDRLRKLMERKKVAFFKAVPFPSAIDLTPEFSRNFFRQYVQPSMHKNPVLLFNLYRGAGQYRTCQTEIFPNDFINPKYQSIWLKDFVFDTNENEIRAFLFEHLYQLSIYFALLSSAASEHSTRFQLMENASNNADRLAKELFIEVQVQRRHKITSEMQELAVGAGLLNKRG